MKARLLKKRLNDTGYIIHETATGIHAGTDFVTKLITVDKKTLELSYSMGDGRPTKNEELTAVWDGLEELIQSGEIQDYIDGEDELENELPCFYESEGKIVETVTDHFIWPNVTKSGRLMFSNTHFPTRERALEKAIREYEAWRNLLDGQIKETKEKLTKMNEDYAHVTDSLADFIIEKQEAGSNGE